MNTAESNTKTLVEEIRHELLGAPSGLQEQVQSLSRLLREANTEIRQLRARNFILNHELRRTSALLGEQQALTGFSVVKNTDAPKRVGNALKRLNPKYIRTLSQFGTSKTEKDLAYKLRSERNKNHTLHREVKQVRRSYNQLHTKSQITIKGLRRQMDALRWELSKQKKHRQNDHDVFPKEDLVNLHRAGKDTLHHKMAEQNPSQRKKDEPLLEMEHLTTQFEKMSLKRKFSDGCEDKEEGESCRPKKVRCLEPAQVKPTLKSSTPGTQCNPKRQKEKKTSSQTI